MLFAEKLPRSACDAREHLPCLKSPCSPVISAHVQVIPASRRTRPSREQILPFIHYPSLPREATKNQSPAEAPSCDSQAFKALLHGSMLDESTEPTRLLTSG